MGKFKRPLIHQETAEVLCGASEIKQRKGIAIKGLVTGVMEIQAKECYQSTPTPTRSGSTSIDIALLRSGLRARGLDIASGEGYGCDGLRRAGASSVIGVEINEDACAHAVQKYKIDVRVGSPRLFHLREGRSCRRFI